MENKNKNSALKYLLLVSGCMMMATCYIAAILFIMKNVNININSRKDEQETLVASSGEEFILEGELPAELQEQILQKLYEGVEFSKEYNKEVESENKVNSNDIEENEVTTVKMADTVKPTDSARTLVSDVTEVVKAAMPSVVAITNQYSAYDYGTDEMINEQASGSGIIISQNYDELLIVTNYHVVESANDLYVKFINGKEVTAYVKGSDSGSDLAVLSVFIGDIDEDTMQSIAIAVLGDSDKLQVGEPAIAIGNSLGYGQSVTTGVISALDRKVYLNDEESSGVNGEFLIQTDAAINPGNSGGALLNVKGEVIGINSSKIADYVIEGMGYALPITTVKPIIDELSLKETKIKVSPDEQAFLGISGSDVSVDSMERYGMPPGVYIVSVLEDTAAEKYGLLKGDIIIEIDGEKVTQMTRIQHIMDFYPAGASVTIKVMRQEKGEYKERNIEIILGKNESYNSNEEK